MNTRVSAVAMLARRFLMSKASDGFLSFIAWVSIVGVSLGVLALVVVTSVINGFEGELVHVITGMHGDVNFYTRGDPITDLEGISERIRRVIPETVAMTPAYFFELMVAGPNGVAGAILDGFDRATVGNVTVLPERVTSGRLPEQAGEVALGSAIADRIGAKVGSDIRIIAPYTGEPEGSNPDSSAGTAKAAPVKVVGIVKMGMYDYDSKFVFATLPYVQTFLNQPGRITTYNLKLRPGTDSHVAAERLLDNFGPPFKAKDWRMLNNNLFIAIKLEKAVISIILTVIVIVAAFNVVSTLMMMIHDKTKEISILKAMGFRPSQSFGLFCVVGIGMGAVGTLVGVLLGLGLSRLLSSTQLIRLPADIYYISYLPVIVRWKEVGMIAASALLVSFVATLYPAYKVARRSPLEGMRYE